MSKPDSVEQLRKELNLDERELILPAPLGPVSLQTLMLLQGWEYESTPAGFPGQEIVLIRGDPPINVFQSSPNEIGFGLLFAAKFRSPYANLILQVDSFGFNSNVELINIISPGLLKNFAPYVDIYDPFTTLGPMFGIIMEPTIALPYNRNLSMSVSLPANAPIAATTLFSSAVTRARIIDKKTFIRSLKRVTAEQMTGVKIDRVL